MNEPHIEIKAWKTKKIDSTKAKEICQKETVIGVITTGGITQPAKDIFDKADIAWVEKFPESKLLNDEDRE
ncbi:MAG: hypothetical protein HC849_25850 [Oscillatoriales cyanobacterium RU_3_3]|nr:hypothetical protein [Oscillatoriales cyanobacterium RU_3_3]NJR25331.1 hypothetical protein [Richelia sp. CSU_2_1]